MAKNRHRKAGNGQAPNYHALCERMPVHKLDNAARMRDNPTAGENAFRRMLVASDKAHEWRRQVPMLGYIADMYCPGRRLIVEIDGGYHGARRKADQLRDERFWKEARIKTVRFTNAQVAKSARRVVDFIKRQKAFAPKVRRCDRFAPDEDLIVRSDSCW